MRIGFYRLLAMLTGAIMLFAFVPRPVSAAPAVVVYFNGEQLHFDRTQPVMKQGRVLVPFRTLFEALGYQVKWVDSGGVQKAIGINEGTTIELTINSRTAMVDGSSVALDVPAQIIKRSTMVPLRFVSEHSGCDVNYATEGSVTSIYISSIGAFEGSPHPDLKVEPNVVQGHARDSQGKALAGVKVYAENQLNYTSYLSAVTDKSGYYRIELPDLATTWHMSSGYVIHLNDVDRPVSLKPDNDDPFGTKKGAVRDFTLDLSNGVVYVWLDYRLKAGPANGLTEQNVVLTLTPIGPSQLGGTGGKLVADAQVYHTELGYGIDRIPIGKYSVTARYVYDGGSVPMWVRVKNNGEYADSVDIDFEPEYATLFTAQLEVYPNVN